MKLSYFFTQIALFLLLHHSILDAQKTWNGPAFGNWATPSNWNPVGVPTASDDVVLSGIFTINMNANPGSCNNLTIQNGATLNFATPNRTLNVGGNLVMSATSSVTGNQNNRILNVAGSLSVSPGAAASIGGMQLNVAGATLVDGSLNLNNNTGVKTFQGAIAVGATGSWTSTVITTAGNLVFQNGITHDGTSFSAGAATFNTNAQSIDGISPLSFGDVDVAGITITNNADVTVANNLAGSGGWTQTSNSMLSIGNDLAITSFDASADPNTVTFFGGNNNQVLKAATYHHLTINKTGVNSANVAGTDPGTVTVNGDLSILGGELQLNTNGDTLTVGGSALIDGPLSYLDFTNANTLVTLESLTLSNGGAIHRNGGVTSTVNAASLLIAATGGSIGRCDFTVSGATTVNGPFVFDNNAGIKTLQGLVTLNPGGSWTSTAITTPGRLIFQNGINHNGTSFSGGVAVFNTNTQNINGPGSLNFADIVEVAGVTVRNNTTVSMTRNGGGSLTGTGTWTQVVNSTLNYSGSNMTINTLNASASGNTVNYNQSGGQEIFNPSNNTYFHLIISGSGTKELQANATISGNVSIEGSARLSAGPNNMNSHNIEVAGNWTNSSSNATAFEPRIRIVTFSSAAPQTIANTGNSSGTGFYNLVINNSSAGGVTFAGTAGNQISIAGGGTLFLTNGKLHIGSDKLLVISHNAEVSPAGGKATSFVDGPVQKIGNSAFVFPTGDGAVWARIGISAPLANSHAFTAQYFHAPFGDNTVDATLDHVSVLEYWTLDRNVGASSVQVTLYWEDENLSKITDASSLRVSRFNGAEWVSAGSGGFVYEPPRGSVTSQPVSSFSPFTFGSTLAYPVNPLPVELIHFSARARGREVLLEWATASERNSDFFAVERSGDGTRFTEIGRVAGAGNSTELKEYDFVDERPAAGVNYYRLRQVDFDGAYEYSPVRVVDMGRPTDFGATVFPNPASESFTLAFRQELSVRGRAMLFNSMGRQIAAYDLPAGIAEFNIPVVNLPAGTYVVRVTAGRESWAVRVVVD
jgi:hypothetical protein